MAETVKLIEPDNIQRNPENPRLIFHQDELNALEDSIKLQGILVPLTLYEDGKQYFLLDGERRWRCALKLGLPKVPVIIQPKPTRMQNLMMMFAIHHRRDEWDPLPTALKLRDLEDLFKKQQGRLPTEAQLAELASLTRGEVRRLKTLLQLPETYQEMLMEELNKPRSQQVITVDHVLEASNAAAALKKRNIINAGDEDTLRKSIIEKFRSKVISNTVAPRKLSKLARAVERKEVDLKQAKTIANRLINDPKYSIDMAFSESVEQADFEHELEQLVTRLANRINEHQERDYRAPKKLLEVLKELRKKIDGILKS
jgi:ParB family transcriptional regulator, chromosome partitioning protein